jgi:DNA gyrase subunit A
LQTSISYNQVALVDKTPTELNLKQAVEIYVNHNKKCIVREAMFDINKAQNRLHIIVGLIKALDIIDNIITMIKASPSAAVAKETLQTKWGFTEVQAKAILDMKLSRLAKLEKEELEQEKKELEALLIALKEICEHPEVELRKRLTELVKKYGDDRRTELTQIDIKPEEKEIAEVVPTNVVVVTTQSGLIKKIPTASFRVQKRGGKGIKSDDEAVMSTIKTNTVDYMMFFTNKGKMYRTIVDNIPDGTNTTKGVPINSLVQLESDEKVIAVTSLHRQKLPKFAIFITKQGLFKKTLLSEYMSTKRNAGIAAIKIKEGDSVANVIFQDDEDIIIITKKGMSIKFPTKDIGTIGRLTTGIKGINLAEGDEVITALPVHKDTDKVAIFTAGGLGKKVDLKDFPSQNRGGKGTIASKEEIVGAAMVSDEDNILVVGNKNSICFSAKDIPLLSRSGIGNILIKNNRVLSVTKF